MDQVKLKICYISSYYYNDECSKYTSDNGTDMTIYDRKNDFNENHLSLCESNCTYKGYNSSSLKPSQVSPTLRKLRSFFLN